MTKKSDDLHQEKVHGLEELASAKIRFFDTMDKALEELLFDLNRKEGKKEHGVRGG